MAKIAAIILPSRRADTLADLGDRLCRALTICGQQRIESDTYRGEKAACMLVRIAPDPLNTAAQPIAGESGAGVACGYYLASRPATGDCATQLLDDWARAGTGGLARADGVYAFARWDSQRECLVAGVDKLGMRPLYWACLPGGGYAVASEIKALGGLMDVLKTNWAAWEEHLTFGFVFGSHTFFEGIARLDPAEILTLDAEKEQSCRVEDFLDSIEIVERPLESFLEEQAEAFDHAMSRLTSLYDAERDTILTLSAGFDSRRALGWLLSQDIRPTAYTVPEVREDNNEFESSIVREICRRAGLHGYTVYPKTVLDRLGVRRCRDLLTDFESDEHLLTAMLAMALDCQDKVNFDGLGAGSQLSGAFVEPEYFGPGGQELFLDALHASARNWINLPQVDGPPLAMRLRSELERWGDNPNRFAYFYLMSRTRREISLAPLSMQANVFESLCPFLDRDMMRSALSFPPLPKIGTNLQARLIEALNPMLADIPSIHSPGIFTGTRYRRRGGRLDGFSRLDALNRACMLSSPSRAWSISLGQRAQFGLAGVIGLAGSHSRLRWQIGKARKIGQLAYFESISQSPHDYVRATASLGETIGHYRNWCDPL